MLFELAIQIRATCSNSSSRRRASQSLSQNRNQSQVQQAPFFQDAMFSRNLNLVITLKSKAIPKVSCGLDGVTEGRGKASCLN
jgi:hypothetical protein